MLRAAAASFAPTSRAVASKGHFFDQIIAASHQSATQPHKPAALIRDSRDFLSRLR
jgi:hypothetical protein